MIELIHAEWTKITGNRWVTGCMIWIFPIATGAFMLLAALVLSLSTSARTGFAGEPHRWTNDMISVWDVPTNLFGRMLLVGFTAVVFAGEYQWGTWKNIIPRSKRIPLILTKFFTLGLLIVVAFLLMSVIMAVGTGLLTMIAGVSYGPRLTGDVLADFLGDYAFKAGLAFISTVIAASYAALAAMLTRSILAGIIVGFMVAFAETIILVIFILLAYFLDIPKLIEFYRITPQYNLENITNWINKGQALNSTIEYADNHAVVLSDSLSFSVAVVAVWLVGLVSLTAYLFRKQDITS